MKRFAMLLMLAVLFGSLAAVGQSIEQCINSANYLLSLKTDSDFSALARTMTAGDELVLSTKLARCQETATMQLTPAQFNRIERIAYKLDADIIRRMFDFLERHHLSGTFNAEEEETRKAK